MWKLTKTENSIARADDSVTSRFVLAVLAVIFACGSTNALGYQDEHKQDSQQTAEANQKIDELVLQLGSSNYVDRQIAVEQLWQFGHQATKALERASKNGDPEVARRAKEVLSVLSMGIDSKTNPELAKLILRFNGSERLVQTEILKELLQDRKITLLFELLVSVESEVDQRHLFNLVMPLESTVTSFGRAGRWEELEFILEHPMTFQFQPMVAVQYHMAKNELEPLVARLKKEILGLEDDGKKIDQKLLNRLIAILVMERRFDEAETYIAKIKKESFRNKLLNQMLLEKGDWDSVFGKMAKEDEDVNDGNGLIEVTESQRAMVSNFVGNAKAYKETVAGLLKKVEEAKADKNKAQERGWRDALAEVGFLNLDRELAVEHWNLEEEGTFELLVEYRMVDKAFELIGLGDTVEQRNLWFQRKMRLIKTLRSKVKRLDKRQEDSDETSTKLEAQWAIYREVINLLDGLGHTDEAVAHCYTIFKNYEDEENVDKRSALIWRLIRMNRYDEARNLTETGFRPDEHIRLLQFIFPSQKDKAAAYWYQQLTARYPNSLDRLKATAGIVNSPFCDLPDFNLDYELANIQPGLAYQKSGYWDYQLATAYEFHGLQREYNLHMEVSRQLGYVPAKQQVTKKAVEDKDYDTVIKHYDSPPYNATAFGALIAADAYLQKGEIKKSALRRALAFAYWSNRYRSSGTLTQLTAVGKQDLATDFLKLQLYQIDDVDEESITNERHRLELANSQKKTQPDSSVIHNRIYVFNHAATDSPGGQSGTYWFDIVVETEKSRAKSLIREGKFKEAADVLIKCDQFAPGDPGIGETLLTELDESGGTSEADRVFEQMSRFYYELLEKHPDSPLHHNNFAWLCACAKRNKDHMLRHSELATSLRPQVPSYLDTLALVYFLKGDLEQAIEYTQKCLAIYPTKQSYRDQLKKFLKAAKQN